MRLLDMKNSTLFCIIFVISSICCEKARFDNYRVYKVSIENKEQLEALKQLADSSDSVKNFLIK